MSTQINSADPQQPKRALHISAASLGTNASGIAASTTSYAGSELSGISQFPAPPTEIPTPTLGTPNSSTPRSFNFTERLPPSIPDYETPTRFRFGFGTPPSPRSPSVAPVPGKAASHDAWSLASCLSSKSGGSAGRRESTGPPPEAPNACPEKLSSPEPSTSNQRTRPLVYQKKLPPHPPITERSLSKHSVAAASSLLDWNDTTSAISVNPSEERLLTTSFITSLLAQSSNPIPKQKSRGVKNRVEVERGNDRSYQVSRPDADAGNDASSPHQSIPLFYPSDLLSINGREAYNSRENPSDDRRSTASHSRRTSRDLSDAFHSEEQLQFVIRRPSIAISRGGFAARPVGVIPAVRIPSNATRPESVGAPFLTSNRSDGVAPKPPLHRADAPQNVGHVCGFDGDRISGDDCMKQNGQDAIKVERMAESAAFLLVSGFQHRLASGPSRPASRSNRASRSEFTLQRNHSMKSIVSSLVSIISQNSAVRRAKNIYWWRQRPLPPLPMGSNRPPEFPNGKEIQQLEEFIPLPTLAKRAEDLSGVLDRGSFPSSTRDRRDEFRYKDALSSDADMHPEGGYVRIDRPVEVPSQRASLFSRFQRRPEGRESPLAESPTAVKASMFKKKRNRRRLWIVAVCVFIGVALAVALPVAISQRGHSSSNCHGNQTGASCTLDATCVCTNAGGSCKPLARSLFLLVQDVNVLFAANFTNERMSDAAVAAAGVSSDGLCANQVLLIDVEPGLNSAAAPNRTKWAQAAMLWNLGLSEDVAAAISLQKFVSSAPWDNLPSTDGPVDDFSGNFVRAVSGFIFDFASQSITPPTASFRDSFPSSVQVQDLSNTAKMVLDRMYSFAIASSNQREHALSNYWTAVLQRQESELEAFIEAIRASPFLIPFDAPSAPGGDALTDLMGNTSSTQFPVPISCYPGLSTLQLERTNTLETSVFGLDIVSSPSHFSEDCFPDRPVYGVVDMLRLRLPFPDDREGVALQASVLSDDAKIRTVVYAGEALSALPASTITSTLPTDPREFGAFDFLDHVLLNYLSSISNITLAMDFVSHILSGNEPPSNANSLPLLEFAIFGSVRPRDIAFSVSSFSTPTGSLFFGSGAAQTFRSWALVNTSTSIAWTENAASSEVVRETSSVNEAFESVWQPASELSASGSTNSDDVQKVTYSLRSLGLFSP